MRNAKPNRNKRRIAFFQRYLSYGAQPTLLELLEDEYSLLSEKEQKRLKRRLGMHSFLLADLDKVSNLKELIKNIDKLQYLKIDGGLKENSQTLARLHNQIEKKVLARETSNISESSLFSKIKAKGIGSSILEEVWPDWILNRNLIRQAGLGFALLVFSISAFFVSPVDFSFGSRSVRLMAFHSTGAIYKNDNLIKSRATEKRKLAKDSEFFIVQDKDTISSGKNSLARFFFEDKTTIQIGPETSLKIEKYQSNKTKGAIVKDFFIEKGIVYFDLPKQNKNVSFTVRGEDFFIKVLGTRFTVGQSKHSFRLILERGKVYFRFESPGLKRVMTIDKPSMVEILKKNGKTRIKKSNIPIELISRLGAFNRLNNEPGAFTMNRQFEDSFGFKTSRVICSSPFYENNSSISGLKEFGIFSSFYLHTGEDKRNYAKFHRRPTSGKKDAKSSVDKNRDTNRSQVPTYYRKTNQNKEKFSPYHDGYTK